MQLLQRGQSPEAIRIVDFRPPSRPEMLEGAGKAWDFVMADITSASSVTEAFSKPWASSVAGLALTVVHTAAAIRPHERSRLLYDRCRVVNVVGTAHVLDAAQTAGADIFIFTSSSSVENKRIKFLIWPWQSEPVHYAQVNNESDFDKPLRPHDDFFGNYGVSKAEAERLVCGANRDGFRTGVLRPGNAVYGQMGDQLVGNMLQQKVIVTWIPHVVQNFVSGRNVALAHLQFEAALSRPSMPPCSGRPFNITDPNPPVPFGNLYDAANDLSGSKVKVVFPPPVFLLLTAHLIEAWCLLLARIPFLTRLGLKEPGQPLVMLQPSVFTAASHAIVDDSAARKTVENGGLGYKGVCTTIDGFCEQMLDWSRLNNHI